MSTETNVEESVMTDRQKKVKLAIESLQKYMNTYDEQVGYLNYTDETIIDDVLYGLGVALDREKYCFADGFVKFKARLLMHLEWGVIKP